MTNTVNTNNQNLRLSALSVGLRSTLRLAFPNIPMEATRVEIIVTNEIAVSYAAEWNAGTGVWECDIPASQFMKVGKQKYEVAYLLDGEQFWDGQGWIEIVKATTKGILPNPETNTTRYYITSINGIYGATETDGNVRIPALYTGAALPPVAEHIENDQFFNTVNNSLYVLANGDWKSVAGSGGGGGEDLTPPNGVVYPKEVQLQNGGFYLIGANSSDNCNAYLPNVDSYAPQTFIIFCRDGTSSRFKDQLGRSIVTNLDSSVISGGTANLRLIGFPTKRYVSVTMRRIKTDSGEEMIHLEVV